jgi:hypothetical protein
MRKLAVGVAIAIAAGIFLLHAAGPFFEPLCPADATPVTAEFLAGDGLIKTSAGTVDKKGESFVTAGKSGALSYGPWSRLRPGSYAVAWYGNVQSESRPTFDVYSHGAILASGSPDLAPSSNSTELFSQRFRLDAPTDALEFRVMVGEHDNVALHAIRLTTFSCERNAREPAA